MEVSCFCAASIVSKVPSLSRPTQTTLHGHPRRTTLAALLSTVSVPLIPAYRASAQANSSSGSSSSSTMTNKDAGPKDFGYTYLWVSADGETHITECNAKNFERKGYSGSPQWVLQLQPSPTKVVLTELDAGFDNPWHCTPSVQLVVTLTGSWYVRTSDGSEREFKPGDVLFQDNTESSPADKPPKHCSGVRGSDPCRQMIVQLDWKPQVDKPGPF